MLETLTLQLSSTTELGVEQVRLAVEYLVDETVADSVKAEFLTRLAQKGETASEIEAFARALRERSIRPVLSEDLLGCVLLDVVGTGGDRLGTFNISTTAAIVASAAGVCVAKHGNRASTSSTGSADVLAALGIPWQLEPDQAVAALRKHGFAFFFAPKYHPAFRHIAPARKLCAARGQPTIFNFLGPLLNPVCPTASLVGVTRPALCEPLAGVLQSLGVQRGLVVCGSVGADAVSGPFLDELSPLGPTRLAEFYQERALTSSILSPELFPIQPAHLDDLKGGDAAANAELIRRILSGQERGPKRDAVLLNSAGALFVAGRAKSLLEGWDLAADVIDNGSARRKLAQLAA